MRALHVYISALDGSCPLMGIPCNSYEDFLKGRCLDCDEFDGKCPTIGQKNTIVSSPFRQTTTHNLICCVFPGLSENSGIVLSPVPKEQKLFLLTSSSAPFCSEFSFFCDCETVSVAVTNVSDVICCHSFGGSSSHPAGTAGFSPAKER